MLKVAATRYADYREAARASLAAYRRRDFAGRDVLFEPGPRGEYVFCPESAHLNFFDPALYHALAYRPISFRRMDSSRVLAISVLGTLARREDLGLLGQVACDDGLPIVEGAADALALELQQPLPFLHEHQHPVVDLWLRSVGANVAVYGRLMERGLDPCLQPYRGHCDGAYARKNGAYCWHTAQGALYWDYAPAALGWDAGRTHRPCPMRRPFGLVRAILAAADPGAHPKRAARCTLLIYDARNPAFAPGSRAIRTFEGLRRSLVSPYTLRRTTWQAIARAMAHSPWYADLLEYLRVKYGIGD